MNGREDLDVIIIGAGAAGLACAAELTKKGKRVIILEARDRIGGRVHTLRERGVIEAGAEFIHGEHATTWDIVRANNLRTEEWQYEFDTSFRVYAKDGKLRTDSDALLADMRKTEEGLYDYEGPEISVAQYLAKQSVSPEALFFASRHIGDLEGADAEKLSASALARESNVATNGPKNFWLVDGYDKVIQALAKGLDIRLSCVVSRIEWRAGQVTVTCADGIQISAPRAVITIPIGVLRSGAISFAPALPATFGQAVQAIGFGNSTKLILWFKGEMENFRMLDSDGLFGHFWPRLFGEEKALVGFSGGSRADTLCGMSEEAAIESGIEEIGDALGSDFKSRITGGRHFTWLNDPFARGSYTYSPVGIGNKRDDLRLALEDTLYYTGEATNANGNTATVHGAIEAGRNTAFAILGA